MSVTAHGPQITSARTRLPAPAQRRRAIEARWAPWRAMTTAGVLRRATAEHGERPLVIGEAATYGYAEIAAWARRIAGGLVALGVAPGDRVAMLLANHPEFVAAKFAIAWAGATCVPLNFLYRAPELDYVLRQSRACVLITSDRHGDNDHLASLDALIPGWERDGGGIEIPTLRDVVTVSPTGAPPRAGARTLDALAALADERALGQLDARTAAEDPEAYCDILYTSGTTGNPKGVLLRHDQVVRESYGAAYQRALEDGRRIAFPMPMYHVFGYMEGLMAVLFVGGAIVPQVSFDAARMLDQITEHRVGEVMAIPAVTLPLLAQIRARATPPDLGSVHTVFSSGGIAPPRIWDDIRDAFGDVELVTGYGQTETTATTTCTDPEDDEWLVRETNGHPRDAGIAGDPALHGHLAVYKAVDPLTEADLPAGTQGHLLVRGPVVTDGYFDKPQETEAALTADGWLRTGDLGWIDDDGLRLTGRLKESLRVGGEMVMPLEIENVLAGHPAVAEAHVVGIPHARMGEVACAWVIPVDAASAPDPAMLVAHCEQRLAPFKVPRDVFVATAQELPRTATGRVQKFRLAELSVRRLATDGGDGTDSR